MTDFTFIKAERRKHKARLAIDGPTGAGKTWTALLAATTLADGGKIAVIDTEHGSASLYSDEFDFDTLVLSNYDPRNYVSAIKAAEKAGYPVIVIDSLSHAWEGEGGTLDQADQQTKRRKDANSFAAWKDITPMQREFVDTMLKSTSHIVVTMRTKMEYLMEKDSNGKTSIKKVGLAPVQRAGIEYEFQLVCDMDTDHTLVVSKSRCKPLADAVVRRPDADWFKTYASWLENGSDTPEPEPVGAQPQQPLLQPSGDTIASRQDIRTQPTPPPAKTVARPMAPDKLVELIDKKGATHQGKLATVADRNAFEGALLLLFPDEKDRGDFLSFVFAGDKVPGISHQLVLAGLDWLGLKGGVPSEFAAEESRLVLDYIRSISA